MSSLSKAKADSSDKYSWWWNSHISSNNSKWLQENLTDVDIKVKAMIKLIEEDADSFAKKAEMYYKNRPELIKLVEEFYRAYRSLAERYDHATGDLRQAHKTMPEAFPNQVPARRDDSAPKSLYDTDLPTSDSRTNTILSSDSVDLQKDGSTGTARKALDSSDSESDAYQFGSVGVNDKEILLLKDDLANLERENTTLKHHLLESEEAHDVLCQKYTETIASLELRLVCAQEETERLKTEIDNGVLLLKAAEEQRLMVEKSNESLHIELESMGIKTWSQNLDITEKRGRLLTCIQEERLRFMEADTAFQVLQQLHAQSQEELRSMGRELQNSAQILREIEPPNEVQEEISSSKEVNKKLEEEVDQINALQQEIGRLKEDLNELNKEHGSISEQVALSGLSLENFYFEEWQTEKTAKEALLEKLEVMGQLLERKVVLGNSLSDSGAELERVRGKLKSLEESYQSLLEEKSCIVVENPNLLGQILVATDNLSHVSEENTVVENSLFDAHVKLKILKQQSRSFKDSCLQLFSQKGALASQMEVIEQTFQSLF